MTKWRRLRSCVRAVARWSRMERQMDAELRFHIEAFGEDLMRSGVPREEALRRARIESGGIERAKGGMPRGTRRKPHRQPCSRLAVRCAHATQETRIHRGCGSYSRPGHRCQHGDL